MEEEDEQDDFLIKKEKSSNVIENEKLTGLEDQAEVLKKSIIDPDKTLQTNLLKYTKDSRKYIKNIKE